MNEAETINMKGPDTGTMGIRGKLLGECES